MPVRDANVGFGSDSSPVTGRPESSQDKLERWPGAQVTPRGRRRCLDPRHGLEQTPAGDHSAQPKGESRPALVGM